MTDTFTPKAGMYCRTRGGNKVGPLVRRGDGTWKCINFLWRSDGLWLNPPNTHENDLIAEWVDERPGKPIAELGAKPGDTIRCVWVDGRVPADWGRYQIGSEVLVTSLRKDGTIFEGKDGYRCAGEAGRWEIVKRAWKPEDDGWEVVPGLGNVCTPNEMWEHTGFNNQWYRRAKPAPVSAPIKSGMDWPGRPATNDGTGNLTLPGAGKPAYRPEDDGWVRLETSTIAVDGRDFTLGNPKERGCIQIASTEYRVFNGAWYERPMPQGDQVYEGPDGHPWFRGEHCHLAPPPLVPKPIKPKGRKRDRIAELEAEANRLTGYLAEAGQLAADLQAQIGRRAEMINPTKEALKRSEVEIAELIRIGNAMLPYCMVAGHAQTARQWRELTAKVAQKR